MYKKSLIFLLIIFTISFISAGVVINLPDESSSVTVNTFTGNLTEFIDLTDTPSSYTSNGSSCLLVKDSEDGIVFDTCPAGAESDPLWTANYTNETHDVYNDSMTAYVDATAGVDTTWLSNWTAYNDTWSSITNATYQLAWEYVRNETFTTNASVGIYNDTMTAYVDANVGEVTWIANYSDFLVAYAYTTNDTFDIDVWNTTAQIWSLVYNDTWTTNESVTYYNETMKAYVDSVAADTQKNTTGNFLYNDTTTIFLNESRLNETINASIDLRTASTTYNASVIVTIEGTLDAGDLTSVQIIDTDWYNVSEDAGGSPLLISINFSGVDTFSNILMRERYSGGLGHEIEIQTWNYDSGSWELHGEITDQSTMVESIINVLDASDHVSGGLVQLRFDHSQNGVGTHDFFIDYIALQEGFTSITNAEHDSLLGRDSLSNHPWALSVNDSRLNASIDIYNSSLKNYTDSQDTTFNTTMKAYVDANVGEVTWLANWTAYNDTWSSITNATYQLAWEYVRNETFTTNDSVGVYNDTMTAYVDANVGEVTWIANYSDFLVSYAYTTNDTFDIDVWNTTAQIWSLVDNDTWTTNESVTYYNETMKAYVDDTGGTSDATWLANWTAYNDTWSSITNATYQLAWEYVRNETFTTNDSVGVYNDTMTAYVDANVGEVTWIANYTDFLVSYAYTTNDTFDIDVWNTTAQIWSLVDNDTWTTNESVTYYNETMKAYVDDTGGTSDATWLANWTAYNTTWSGATNTSYRLGTNNTFYGDANFTGDIQMADNKSLKWTDAVGFKRDALVFGENTLYIGDTLSLDIMSPGAMNFFSHSGLDGAGNFEPSIELQITGEVLMANTNQGSAGDRYFTVEMTDGMRIIEGNLTIGADYAASHRLNVIGDANITGLIYGNGSQLTNLPSGTNATYQLAWEYVRNETFTTNDSVGIYNDTMTAYVDANVGEVTWLANWTAYNTTWSSITNATYQLAWEYVRNETFTTNDSVGVYNDTMTAYVDDQVGGEPLWEANYTDFLVAYAYTTNDTFDIDVWNTTAQIWSLVDNNTWTTNESVTYYNETMKAYVDDSGGTSDATWLANWSAYNTTWSTDTDTWNTTAQIWAIVDNNTWTTNESVIYFNETMKAYVDDSGGSSDATWVTNWSYYNTTWSTDTDTHIYNTTAEIWSVVANGTFTINDSVGIYNDTMTAYVDANVGVDASWLANWSAYNNTWSSITNSTYQLAWEYTRNETYTTNASVGAYNSTMKLYCDAQDLSYNTTMTTYVDTVSGGSGDFLANYSDFLVAYDYTTNDTFDIDVWNTTAQIWGLIDNDTWTTNESVTYYNETMKAYVDSQDTTFNTSIKNYADDIFIQNNSYANLSYINSTTIQLQEITGNCDLTKPHSICSNGTGTYIIG